MINKAFFIQKNSARYFLLISFFASAVVIAASPVSRDGSDHIDKELQSSVVTGRIVDGSGNPIIGATIKVKGTGIGAVSDLDGNFSVPVTKGTLVVSYVGYKTQEIVLQGQSSVRVLLKEDNSSLDEVVVIGYGSQKKSDLTGSLSSVTSKDIDKMPVTNLATAMQGRVPGAVISSNDGNPGSGLKIRIRGANSINGSNDPLYIIDGVPGNINLLNVDDVESMEILKDASATAIYGSRGANGVVLITTKEGANMPTRIEVSSNVGMSTLPKKYDIVSAADYANTMNTITGTELFSADEIAAFEKNGGTDWQNEIFRTGSTQDYKVSLSGGSDQTTYYISGNYVNQQGIVVNTNSSRYNLRSNISTKFLDKFRLDFKLSAFRSKGLNTTDNGSKGSPIWLAPIMSPTYSPYADDGSWNTTYDNIAGPGAGYKNPLMVLNERHSDYINSGWDANAKLNYQIFKDLSLDIILSGSSSTNNAGSVSNLYISSSTTGASQTVTQYYGWQNSNILTYHHVFNGIHDLTVTGVNEQSYSKEKQVYAGASDIDPITVGYDDLGLGNSQNVSSYRKDYTLQSFLGRVSYSLLNRYLVTASYRADGSSKFTKNHKWAYFPSAALAWRVTEEPWMKNQKLLNNMKIRASWGETGNQGIDVYANLTYYGNLNHSFGQDTSFTGTTNSGAYNQDLKWETTAQTNAGLDLGFFNGRLNLTADYYVKTTKDLLLNVDLPYYDGGGSVLRNVGTVRNKGFEFTLFGTPMKTETFRWDMNFNISHYKSKVISLGNETEIAGTNPNNGLISESAYIIRVGEELGSIYGYKWLGVYSESEAAEAAKYGFKPGDNKYADLDGDGSITSSDREIIGHTSPKLSYGFDNTITYKDFTLDILLQGVSGNKILNTTYAAGCTVLSDAPAITIKDGLNYWTEDNQNAYFANPLSSTNKNYVVSTEYLQSGSYLKLKNIALSWLLKKDRSKFADIKFTISAQNLFCITGYKGYDPEVTTYSGDTNGGLDMGAYPNPRSFTFGIQFVF
jgi:TonB-linked SusC/RagA family outer membrane protein